MCEESDANNRSHSVGLRTATAENVDSCCCCICCGCCLPVKESTKSRTVFNEREARVAERIERTKRVNVRDIVSFTTKVVL